MHRITAMFVAAALFFSSCSDDAAPDAAPATTESTAPTVVTAAPTSSSSPSTSTSTTTSTALRAAAVTAEIARNTSVMIDGTEVQLRDGGAEPELDVRVTGTVVGDMTGDGIDDVAMVVFHTLPGTTGHISSLVVVHDPGAGPVATNDVHISDIARIHDVRVEGGATHVTWSAAQISGQRERSVFVVDEASTLARQDSQLDLLIDGTPDGFHLGSRQGGQVPYGSGFDRVRDALTPLLGEPSDEGTSETCWGRHDNLLWDSPDGSISVGFLEDEFYTWWATDPRVVVDEAVVSGASVSWLEQLFGTEFTTVYSEIGGDYVSELDARVTLDETGTRIGSVGDSWWDEWARLHTVIHDPVENPDLWCGD